VADREMGIYHPAMPASASGAAPRRRRESKAARQVRAAEIRERLAARYPAVTTALDHRSAWELLVATILSAQSTDVVVNQVTPELFRRYPTPADLAAADRTEVEAAIHATGFFRNKAKSIQGAAAYLLQHHGGEVPETIDELVELPGVGRKTANVVLGTYFSRNEGVVVDTHVGRLSRRLGLTRNTDPVKVEGDLMDLVPVEEWTIFSHRLIWFGREVCTAKDPRCDRCELADLCPSAFKVGRFAKASKAVTPRARR
jgi:endonuclease-3